MQKDSQFNLFSKKKYDLIIIFKQENNLVSLVKKHSNTNTKIIDIGRYINKSKKNLINA